MAKETATATRVANLPARTSPGEIMETVLIRGDLSKLTVDERNTYYFRLCESVGLNPLTQPIEYINLNGKLRLYAKKDCTDQLRAIHKISVTEMIDSEREGVHIVTSKVCNSEGRTDIAKGAVNIAGLKGEALANAMMKAETKSKRRATLSICGLGILDETEVDDIPRQQVRVPSPSEVATQPEPAAATSYQKPREITPEKNDTFALWEGRYLAAIKDAQSLAELIEWDQLNDTPLGTISNKSPQIYTRIMNQFEALKAKFKPDPISTGTPPRAPTPVSDFPGDKPMPSNALPEGCPDPTREPDQFLNWAAAKLAQTETPEALEIYWTKVVEPAADGLLKPDYEELQGLYAKNQKRLGAD